MRMSTRAVGVGLRPHELEELAQHLAGPRVDDGCCEQDFTVDPESPGDLGYVVTELRIEKWKRCLLADQQQPVSRFCAGAVQ